MWFGQTGLNTNRLETGLSASVNRAIVLFCVNWASNGMNEYLRITDPLNGMRTSWIIHVVPLNGVVKLYCNSLFSKKHW